MSDLMPKSEGRFHPFDKAGPGGAAQDSENNRGCFTPGVTPTHEAWSYPGGISETSKAPEAGSLNITDYQSRIDYSNGGK